MTKTVLWSFRSTRGFRRPLIVENQPVSWGIPCGIEVGLVPLEQDFLVVDVLMSAVIWPVQHIHHLSARRWPMCPLLYEVPRRYSLTTRTSVSLPRLYTLVH